MTREIGNDVAALPGGEDFQKQVLDRYEARQRSFIKQSTIFFIFVFSFLAFILVPMISLKLEAKRIKLELERKPQEISALQGRDTAVRAEAAKLGEQRDLAHRQRVAFIPKKIWVYLASLVGPNAVDLARISRGSGFPATNRRRSNTVIL